MTQARVDGWARRLARADDHVVAKSGSGGVGESALDGVARALVAPVTRRRAVGLIGGAVIAGSLLRPGRARAQNCFPGGPKICTAQGGQRVCVPENLQCCNNDKCAIACPYSYRDCEGPGVCQDTARMCTDPVGRQEAGISDANRTKFCSANIPVTGSTTCGQPETVFRRRGWCCRQNEDCRLVRDSFGTCKCPDDQQGRGPRDCGDSCCPKGEICVTTGGFIGGRQQQCKPLCPKGWHYDDNARCVCDTGQTCGVGCCPEGKVCQGNRCVSPTDPSGSFKDFFKSFGDFTGTDVGNQTAGSRAGGNYLRIGFAAAGPGPTPVRSALLLLAAVNAQGAAAAIAFTDSHVDRSYRRRVVAARPRLPKLAGTTGFDPATAGALDALLAAEAKAFAQIAAAAKALARSRGALRARKTAQARRQALAAANFASAAARSLRGIPSVRAKAAAALRTAGVAEVSVEAIDVTELQDAVEASGIPAELTALLKGLGVTGDDLKRARQAFAVAPSGGPALIAPLGDAARTRNITKLAGEFAKYARSARRSSIRRSRVQPRRVRAPRATSRSR